MHMKYHTKPHVCKVCSPPKGYGSSKDLRRHQKEVHRLQREETWECTVLGCKKRGKQYDRKENCKRHYRIYHPLIDPKQVGL